MKKFLLKFSKFSINFVLTILLILSLGTVGFTAASFFVAGLNEISFAYVFIGEFLYPIEFLANGEMGVFYTSTMKIVCLVAGGILLVLSIICLNEFRKIGKRSKNAGEKANSNIKTGILAFILAFIGTISMYYLFSQFMVIKRTLNKSLNGIVQQLLQNVGVEVLLYKGIAILAIVTVSAVLLFIVNIFDREKHMVKNSAKGTKKEINFYSEDYIGINKKQVAVDDVNEEIELDQDIKPKKKQAEDLVTKIMQLNKLKDNGQINEVEYTKLRQKAIRRYKG